MTTAAGTGTVHSWLSHRYARDGRSNLRMCALVALAMLILALTPVTTLVTGRYMGLSIDQWLTMMSVSQPCNLIAVGIAVLSCRRQLGMIGAWAAGERVGLSPQEVAAAAH